MNFHGGYIGSDNIIDFSVNIPTLPYPDGLEAVLIDEIKGLRKYPEIDGITACHAISEAISWPVDQIILGNGATELIYLYARSVKIQKALIIEPTFTEYKRALELNGVPIETLSVLDEFHVVKGALEVEIDQSVFADKVVDRIKSEKADLLVLCNPNNPTGHYYSADFIRKIIEGVNSENFKVFIDESFSDFLSDDISQKVMLTDDCPKNVFLMRSMTKNFEVPGLRIGYGLADKSTINLMKKYKEPWSLNAFALKAIPFFMTQTTHLEGLKKWSNEELLYTLSELIHIKNVEVFRGYANYLLMKVPDGEGHVFFDRMLSQGIYLRRCEDFQGLGESYFRIALRSREENAYLVKIVKEVMENEDAK